MNPADPQFLYMMMILPSLFGLTLIGEGLNKVFHAEYAGFISIVFGMIFVGFVAFAYVFFTTNPITVYTR